MTSAGCSICASSSISVTRRWRPSPSGGAGTRHAWRSSARSGSWRTSWVMSADDKLDSLAGSVSDGRPVDWVQEETQAEVDQESSLRALRDVSLIAEFSRDLQRGVDDAAPGDAESAASEAPDNK